MTKGNRIDEIAKITGLVFGILFFIVILIGTIFPFGIALDSKAYLESGITMIYAIGLFIGIRWKGSGALICIVAIVASVFAYFFGRTIVNFTYIIVSSLIQMIPVTLYVMSWYYHRQSKAN